MSNNDNPTTAQILGQYRRELIAEDVPDYEADQLVRIAAHNIYRHDDYALIVTAPRPGKCGCLKCCGGAR